MSSFPISSHTEAGTHSHRLHHRSKPGSRSRSDWADLNLAEQLETKGNKNVRRIELVGPDPRRIPDRCRRDPSRSRTPWPGPSPALPMGAILSPVHHYPSIDRYPWNVDKNQRERASHIVRCRPTILCQHEPPTALFDITLAWMKSPCLQGSFILKPSVGTPRYGQATRGVSPSMGIERQPTPLGNRRGPSRRLAIVLEVLDDADAGRQLDEALIQPQEEILDLRGLGVGFLPGNRAEGKPAAFTLVHEHDVITAVVASWPVAIAASLWEAKLGQCHRNSCARIVPDPGSSRVYYSWMKGLREECPWDFESGASAIPPLRQGVAVSREPRRQPAWTGGPPPHTMPVHYSFG